MKRIAVPIFIATVAGCLFMEAGRVYCGNAALAPMKKLERGLSAITEDADKDTVLEAVVDLVKYSYLLEDSAEASNAIDECLKRFGEDKETHNRLTLAKAEFLAKTGSWDEAKKLFDQAIEGKYEKAANTYLECLTAIGKNKERAIEEYNLCVDEPSYLDYRGRKEDLSVFATVLLFARENNTEFSAIDSVFPYLVFEGKNENVLEITRALCLATDGKYAESIQALQGIGAKLNEKSADADTYKTLPLYIAWILFDQGEENAQAREWLQIFSERNSDDPGHVLGRILRIAYYFERYAKMRHKIVEVTEFLLNSEMFEDQELRAKLNAEVQSNPQMKATMPDDLYAHVLELHAHSLSWKYDWENAVKIWDRLIADYYPQTVTGASALMSKAVYIASKNNPEGRDALGALDYLNDITEHAPFEGILPHVLRLKAKYQAMLARYDEARETLKQVYDLIPPNPAPEFKECLNMAKALEQAIPQMEEYKRLDDEHDARKARLKNMTPEERRAQQIKQLRDRHDKQQANQ